MEDILITEKEHLHCKQINFNGMLERINSSKEISVPIAIRKIEGSDKYNLIMGISRLFCCKVLGIKNVPCILTGLNDNEFKVRYLDSKNNSYDVL